MQEIGYAILYCVYIAEKLISGSVVYGEPTLS